MDRVALLGINGASLVYGVTYNVDDPSQSRLTHRHANSGPGVNCGHTAPQAVRG